MKLFIIGNGFDLYHNYKTSYLNFRDYLTENENNYKIGELTLLDILSPEENYTFWKDFEENLATISLNRISAGYNQSDPVSRNNLKIIENIRNINEDLYSLIQNALSDFIEIATKERNEPKSLFMSLFGLNDKFITFNYSLTLQKIYNIESNKINYIHGMCIERNDEEDNTSIVFGHSGNIPDSLYANNLYDDEDKPEYLKAKIRNSLSKSIEIYEYEKFIGNISIYDEIHIIGHSLGIVDETYFNKINTKSTKKIIYWQYVDKDLIEEKTIKRIKELFYNVNCLIIFYDEQGIQKQIEIQKNY